VSDAGHGSHLFPVRSARHEALHRRLHERQTSRGIDAIQAFEKGSFEA